MLTGKPLAGQVALVTGSGRGLGRAMARRLAELGADVVAHDISQSAPAEFGEAGSLDEVAEGFRRLGGRALAVTGDIANEADVRAMVQRIESSLGSVSILVNCAGGDIAARGGKPQPNNALGIPMEDVQAIFNRNLFGTMLMCRSICPGMMSRRAGSVVNIGSLAAHIPVTDGVAYAVAKAAIIHYSWCLAADLRPHGVRVNVVSPGPAKSARFLVTRKLDETRMDETVPLVRYAKPDEIADAVAFLASEASRFITGQVLRVDGGAPAFIV